MTPDNPLARRKIFLSYRRADHPDFVERIRDWFAWKYGRDSIFMDFDTIPPFTRFADFIREKVSECDVLIAVIGPQWLDLLNQRMSESEEDYVRVEIRLALEEGKPIAPICIKGASSPRRKDLPLDLQAMMDYNMAHLNSGRHFLDHIERTVEGVEQLLARIEMFSSVTQDIESYRKPTFDIQSAILSFQEAADSEDWYLARDWLKRIRHSGFMPRFYPIEDYETEVQEAIERLEAQRDYDVIRSMAARAEKGREDKKRVWSALQVFWEAHPAYDPDDLASYFRPDQPLEPVLVPHTEIIQKETTQVSVDDFDLAFFDQLGSLDLNAAEALFAPDAIAEQLAADDDSLTYDEAEKLGLVSIES
jgi:hypothetical protein